MTKCTHCDATVLSTVKTYDPLPRCKHGNCLMDGGGEILEPPCGCRALAAAPAVGGEPVAWRWKHKEDACWVYTEVNPGANPLLDIEALATPQPASPLRWRDALEPFIKAARIIAKRPDDYEYRIVMVGGLMDACDLNKGHFADLLTAVDASPPQQPAAADVSWAVNVLLEEIAEKFEEWETLDLWRSDAAITVRSFMHDLAAVDPDQETT